MKDLKVEILTSGCGTQVTLESFLIRPIGRKINDEQNKV